MKVPEIEKLLYLMSESRDEILLSLTIISALLFSISMVLVWRQLNSPKIK